jgi:toxin HigB-1
MWSVYETTNITKSLKKIPRHIQIKYKAWVEIVKMGGSDNLRHYPGFRDEKLKGELRECRSSRLNIQYRVIYEEKKHIREIIVMNVTPHDYKG